MTSSSETLKLIFITDSPASARIAIHAGVDRIMIDLEHEGKQARQGHLDTLISNHDPVAIKHVRKELDLIGKGELLVRVNPLNSKSKEEVDNVIALGAQRIMLPMFKNSNEVITFLGMVDRRVPVTLLLETKSAYENLDSILKINKEFDIHIGLNDLHIDMELSFMFQLLTNGVVDNIAEQCRKSGCAFGIGGVAPLSVSAKLSPDDIIAYHLYVGSNAVILSRDWQKFALKQEKFISEVSLLRDRIVKLPNLNRKLLEDSISDITSKLTLN